jgi:exodeoxyribonuclease VII large subunit
MAGWLDDMEPTKGVAQDEGVETVSKVTRRIKSLLETGVNPGWIQGEVSNLRRQSSGHTYFVLKDAGAQLSCVLFRGDGARQTVKLQDGQQVLLAGRISVYEARGQYQLIVRSIKEDGVGRLQREFEALKLRLAEEGLFDQDAKKSLPPLALKVGIVTSPTGAAVQDFARILLRRGWRGKLTVIPAKVQGGGAAAEIATMIAWAGDYGEFDVLVIGRGGGSLEDLWAFNEERLVRAVAACPIPVISAVGHEIDFTLSDFAADVRAETPSGAAELISSSYAEMCDRLDAAREDLAGSLSRARENAVAVIGGLRNRLRLLTPRAQIEQGWFRRDELATRLRTGLASSLGKNRHQLLQAQSALAAQSPERRVEFESHRLLSLWKRLQSVSPQATLNRGFVVMRDAQNRPVMKKADVQKTRDYEAEFADGRVKMRQIDEKSP